MLSKKSFLNRLKIVQSALENNLVTPSEAKTLIERLEFMWRCSDILEWGKYYFQDKFTLPFCEELHRYFIEVAEDPFTSTLAPRGHAKTTIKCFLIPIFFALNHPDKFKHYLNIQSTSAKAVSVSLSIRHELENNELLMRDYGCLVSDEKWTEKQFILTNGVIFTAIGAGESFRGKNYRNVRPDYVVLDDLYDEEDIENPDRVLKKNRWWWGTVYKAVANDRHVSIHIQGTAINRNDLMHTLMKNSRWKGRKFQAVKSWDTEEVLWPEANTIETLRQDKNDMGSIMFEREMQNEVRDEASAIIKLSDIRFYDGRQFPTKYKAEENKKRECLYDVPEYVIWNRGCVDPAEKEKEINDFTAKVAGIKTNLGNIYIYDATNEKLSFNANKNSIIEWSKRLALQKVLIETNKGQALFDEINRTTDIPIEGKHETKDKITRKTAQSAKFENHKVFISMLIPQAVRDELVEQLTINKPTHDDLADAAINVLEFDSKRELFIG